MAAIGVAPSGTVVAEDIRNLQIWTGHEGHGLLGRLVLLGPLVVLAQLIERAHDLGDQVGGHARVVRGRIEALVASRAWIIRISSLLSSRWVAKLCRKVCSVAPFLISAASAAK